MRALALLLIYSTECSTAYAGNELSIGSSDRALRSSSADAVTADSLTGGQLGFAHELHLGLADLTVSATLGLWWGSAKGSLFDLATDLGQSAYLIGGRARYAVMPHIAASAGVQVGLARTSLDLTDSMDRRLSDAAWGGIADGALALDLLAVDTPRFSLGMRVELGYVAAASVTLAGKASHPDDGTLRLAMTQASLGQLDLSGPYASVSVMSAF
jgi:hypothetical protein